MEQTDLADYEEEEQEMADATTTTGVEGGSHVAMSSTGWKDFMLDPLLSRAISDCGFEHPSEVQQQVIPQAILGNDIICQAKSGMGKTAVFVISIIQQNLKPKDLVCIVLVNTRELAMQINKEFRRFTKYLPDFKSVAVYGGESIDSQITTIKSEHPNVICATPGRMMDFVERKILDLSHIKHFVLDECDKILDEERIRRQMQTVFIATPKDKQVMMFSATLTGDMRDLTKKYTHNPHTFFIDEEKLVLHGLKQYYFPIADKDKNRKLLDILDTLDFNQCIIFVSSKIRAEYLNKLLNTVNFPSICTHSDMNTQQRIQRFTEFREGKFRILVSTDLMGRGIDVESINVVVNYDMTTGDDGANQYLHRVGRAGRFGTKGLAVSFISSQEDRAILEKVQDHFSVKIPVLPDLGDIDPSWYRYA